MKRRELLKGLSIVAGNALCAKSAWPMPGTDQSPEAGGPLVTPIRGLVNKAGKLLQPVRLTFRHSRANETAITKLNGTEVDRRALSGSPQSFDVFTAPAGKPQQATVDIETGGKATSTVVTLQPVRKVLVYILPHSHHDLGYTDLQSNVEEKQMRNITTGMELARRTASYPEGARFVWNLEVLWGADLFMRRGSRVEKAEFIEAVKKGWVSLNGMYANELTGLCRPEGSYNFFAIPANSANNAACQLIPPC